MAPELSQSGSDEEDSGASQRSRDDQESQSANTQSDSSKTHSTGAKGPQKTAEERARDEKKQQETSRVNQVRFVCLAVFLATAVAVCVAMFKFTSGNEHSTFEVEVSCP